MANNLTIGDQLQFIIATAVGDQAALTTFHAQDLGPHAGTPTDLDMAIAFDNRFQANFKSFMSNNATYRGTSCRIMNKTPALPFAFFVGNAGVGALVFRPSPRQSRGVVNWQTAFAGRAYRGRVFLPFTPAAGNNVDGTPSAAVVALWDSIRALFGNGAFVLVNGGAQTTVQPTIYHRTAAIGGIPAARTMTPVTSGITSTLWGTQKKTGDRGRANPLPF